MLDSCKGLEVKLRGMALELREVGLVVIGLECLIQDEEEVVLAV